MSSKQYPSRDRKRSSAAKLETQRRKEVRANKYVIVNLETN